MEIASIMKPFILKDINNESWIYPIPKEFFFWIYPIIFFWVNGVNVIIGSIAYKSSKDIFIEVKGAMEGRPSSHWVDCNDQLER